MSNLHPISEAPRDAVEIRLVTTQGEFVAHNAEDQSGEFQPAFGPAWYYMPKGENCYCEVPGKILGWRPLKQYAREPETTA